MSAVKGTSDAAFYFEHGYFQLRPANPAFLRDVDEAARAFQEVMGHASEEGVQTAFKNKDGKGRHLLFVHRHRDVFRRLMFSDEVADLVRSVFASLRIYVTHSKISHKEVGQDLPWYPHQDNGYKVVSGLAPRKGMTIGIFLEDADDRNGTLQIFAGTHKLGAIPHVFKKENQEDFSGQLAIEQLPEGAVPTSIVARKGDIVIFSLDAIHQSGPNLSHGFRPILLFETEPYSGFPSDEQGNPPVLLNGELTASERLLCRLNGLPKKAKQAVGALPLAKKWYRKLKFG